MIIQYYDSREPREADYVKAEERVVSELKAINKPFVILLNSEHPNDPETLALSNELSQKYNSTTIPINCANLNLNDITNIFSNILYEFPVSQINFKFPALQIIESELIIIAILEG